MLSGRLDDPRPSRDGEDVLVADRVLRGGDVLRRTCSGVAQGRGWRERASRGQGEVRRGGREGVEREGVEKSGVERCDVDRAGVERRRREVWRGVEVCVCVAWGGAWSETIFLR